MPNLPTLTLPQGQIDRIIAAFAPGGTQAEAVARYKEWLRIELKKYVVAEELRLLRVQHLGEQAQREQEIDDELLPAPPPPPPVTLPDPPLP